MKRRACKALFFYTEKPGRCRVFCEKKCTFVRLKKCCLLSGATNFSTFISFIILTIHSISYIILTVKEFFEIRDFSSKHAGKGNSFLFCGFRLYFYKNQGNLE